MAGMTRRRRRRIEFGGGWLGRAVMLALLLGCGLRAQELPHEDYGQLLSLAPGPAALNPGERQVEAAIQQKHYGEAEQLLYARIQKTPAPAALLRQIGGVFFLDHRYLNCAIAMKKAEALAPLDERSRFLLAMSYVLMGHPDWARPELTALSRQNPQKALYPYWLARLDYGKRRYPQALVELQQALKIDAAYANGWDLQGLCQYAEGKYALAVASYTRAVEENLKGTRSPWPPLDFGSLLVKLGRLDEAAAQLREAVRLDGGLEPAHLQLGLVLEKQHHRAAAMAELEQAASLAPRDPAPHYGLARMYRNDGEMARASTESARFEKLRQELDAATSPKSGKR